jgi:hypothetical protein
MWVDLKKDVVRRFRQKASIGEIESTVQYLCDIKRADFEKVMETVEEFLFEELRKKVDNAMNRGANHMKVIEEYSASVTEFNMYQIMSYVEANAVMSRTDAKLMKIATEHQSVHLDEIEEKTRRNLQTLHSLPPPEVNTVDFLIDYWSSDKYSDLFFRDIAKLYEIKEYKMALDGALSKILQNEHKEELLSRLKEELREGMHMCISGRLARICNVFAGFDEDFSVDMPVLQKVQNLFGKLSEQSVGLDRKLRRAREILQDYKSPVGEWAPWLEALG